MNEEKIQKMNKAVEIFLDFGMAISPEIIDEITDKKEEEIVEIAQKAREKNVTILTESTLREIEGKIPIFVEIKKQDFKPIAKEYEPEFKIIKEKDITGKSKCKGEVEDFLKYFRDRFKRTSEIIINRPSNYRLVNVNFLNSNSGKFRIIVIVNKKMKTKNGHYLIEGEDETGTANFIILKDSPAFQKGNAIVTDEVLAFDVRTGKNFHIVEDVIFPDLSIREKRKSEKEVSVAFLSDIHVASKFFCNLEFEKLLKFLNGSVESERIKKISESIGYILIAGDVVDGIGIYPKQEKELIIKDIFDQYKTFSKLLDLIPDYIHIFISPGNHDSVRQAEPQPALKDFIEEKDNIHLVSNPSYIVIEGLNFLIYHGTSLDSMISSIPGLSYHSPENAIIELLRKRNLVPIYDKNEIAPENFDYLFIEDWIDVFHTGHIHKNVYTEYRGRVVINSGTWQSQTEFQLKQGHIPTPCILPVYNLREGTVEHFDFKI